MQHITTQHNHHNIIAWLSLRQCTAMYVNVRQCTAMYNTTEYDVWFRAASRRLGIHTDKHSVNPPNWCQPQRFHSVVKFVEELQSCSARVQQTPHCLVSRPICCWSARFGPAQTGSIAASTVQPQQQRPQRQKKILCCIDRMWYICKASVPQCRLDHTVIGRFQTCACLAHTASPCKQHKWIDLPAGAPGLDPPQRVSDTPSQIFPS